MKIDDPRHPWMRLTAAARQVRDERDVSAPYGFATRVAALAFAQERTLASLFDRFALRALGLAALVAVFSVALNYGEFTGNISSGSAVVSAEEILVPGDEAVAVVLDLGQ